MFSVDPWLTWITVGSQKNVKWLFCLSREASVLSTTAAWLQFLQMPKHRPDMKEARVNGLDWLRPSTNWSNFSIKLDFSIFLAVIWLVLQPWHGWNFLAARPIGAQLPPSAVMLRLWLTSCGFHRSKWSAAVSNHSIHFLFMKRRREYKGVSKSVAQSKGIRLIPAARAWKASPPAGPLDDPDNSCPMELRWGCVWQMWRRTCVWLRKMGKDVVWEGISVKFLLDCAVSRTGNLCQAGLSRLL